MYLIIITLLVHLPLPLPYCTTKGSESSERTWRGGVVRIEGEARIQGVCAYRMGQINTLGAYPFHFHMLGWAASSYIRDSAVYRSYYRSAFYYNLPSVSTAIK